MPKAILVRPDNTAEIVNPSTLDDYQRLIGGYIQQCCIFRSQNPDVKFAEKPAVVIADEEGLVKRLPLNKIISKLADMAIVGNVLLVGTAVGGEWTDCPQWAVDEVTANAKEVK